MPIPLQLIKEKSIPDTFQAILRLQARKTPILLSGRVKVKSFWLDPEYFEYMDGIKKELELLKSESDKISLEKLGDIAVITMHFKPYFVYPKIHHIVYNEGRQDTTVGKLIVDVFYTYNGKEEPITVEIPIRYS